MSVANSQLSAFKSPDSIINRKRTMLDLNGFDLPLSYYYKSIWDQPLQQIIIKVPQQLQTYVTGDKQVNFRYFQVLDTIMNGSFTEENLLKSRIRVIALKQRNNIDISGIQSQTIGYLTYDLMHKYFKGESQLYEMDSKDDIKIQFEIFDLVSSQWKPYTTYNYMYFDCEVQYDYNQNN